jgi:hypothetical protein
LQFVAVGQVDRDAVLADAQGPDLGGVHGCRRDSDAEDGERNGQ